MLMLLHFAALASCKTCHGRATQGCNSASGGQEMWLHSKLLSAIHVLDNITCFGGSYTQEKAEGENTTLHEVTYTAATAIQTRASSTYAHCAYIQVGMLCSMTTCIPD